MLSLAEIKKILHNGSGCGPATGSFTKETLPTSVFRNGGDEIIIGGDSCFQCFCLKKGGFYHCKNCSIGDTLSGSVQLADIAHFIEAGNIFPGDTGNPGGRHLLLSQAGIKGNIGADHELTLNIIAFNIGSWIRFGISEALGIVQNTLVIIALLMHHTEDIISGTIHNAADLIDGTNALEPLQIGQPGNAAANRSRSAETDTGFFGKSGQFIIIGGKQMLIGGDNIFAGAHGGYHIFMGRLQTAHDLHDGIHFPIIQNRGKIGDRNST